MRWTAESLNLEDYKLDQLRLMHIGAQPVPQSLVKRWLTYFPNQQYDTNYGLSESIGPGCVHLGVENTRKVGAIGVPGYGWQVKIVDEKDCPVKGQEVGELCVKGDGVMVCYYNDEKATKEVLKDGWLYTGDMAMQDEEGFIFLVDRKKDVIISGGENLYPVQIEDFLSSHPDVMDVAVIGRPIPVWARLPPPSWKSRKDITAPSRIWKNSATSCPAISVPRNHFGKGSEKRHRQD